MIRSQVTKHIFSHKLEDVYLHQFYLSHLEISKTAIFPRVKIKKNFQKKCSFTKVISAFAINICFEQIFKNKPHECIIHC